jgi:predicted permease
MPDRGISRASISLVDYRDVQSKNRSLSDLAAYYSADYNVLSKAQPERVHAAASTANLFQVLEEGSLLGTVFTSKSEIWGSHRVALIGEQLWKQYFGANASIIGQSITLNDESYTVLGVMRNSFAFPDTATQVWVPLSFAPGDPRAGSDHYLLNMVGRLKSDVSVTAARAELSSLMPHINPNLGIAIEGLKTSIVGDVRPTLLLLTGAVVLVMLIACINVANLLMVRAGSRNFDLSVRVAVGASQRHVVQQVLVESLMLALMGGAVGVAFAFYFIQIVKTWSPSEIPRLQEIGIDFRALLFAFLLSLLTGLLFAAVPALRASRVKPLEALKGGAGDGVSSRKAGRQRILIVGEISLSLALVICAGLLILSLAHLQSVRSGFKPEHTVTARLNFSPIRYFDPQRASNALQDIINQVRALPEVQDVGATTLLPLTPGDWNTLFSADGQPVPRTFADVAVVRDIKVTPDYFRAIGLSLEAGRYFNESDRGSAQRVMIVNKALAHKFWPDTDPILKTGHPGPPESLFGLPAGTFPKITVIGVVDDVRHDGLDQETKPTMFTPQLQAGNDAKLSWYLVLRTKTGVAPTAGQITSAIHAVDPTLPVADVRTMEERLHDSLSRRSHTMLLLSIFAGSALLLAVVGVYGFLSYNVVLRTREVGLRMALGATGFDVLRLILGQAALLTSIGIILGLILGFIFAELAKGLLFGVRPINFLVYSSTAILLFGISLLGAYIPAKRASLIDPMQALRHQ